MPPYKVTLQANKTLCTGTSAFYFAKPAGFEFEAGQFVNFTLLGPGHTDQDTKYSYSLHRQRAA
jgi:ferredoxin-NADP reductase